MKLGLHSCDTRIVIVLKFTLLRSMDAFVFLLAYITHLNCH